MQQIEKLRYEKFCPARSDGFARLPTFLLLAHGVRDSYMPETNCLYFKLKFTTPGGAKLFAR